MWKPLLVLAVLVIVASAAVVTLDRHVVQMSTTALPLDLRGGIAA